MIDPSTLSDEQIATELATLEPDSPRHWRLSAEQTFRKGKAMTADDVSQAERRRILSEERKAKTYLSEAQINTDLELGGRFAKLPKTTVVGASPGISYPRLPQDSPSNQMAMMPDEPSLGYSVETQEPTGEIWEQEASRGAPAKKAGWRRF
jgi:hypothetical protein